MIQLFYTETLIGKVTTRGHPWGNNVFSEGGHCHQRSKKITCTIQLNLGSSSLICGLEIVKLRERSHARKLCLPRGESGDGTRGGNFRAGSRGLLNYNPQEKYGSTKAKLVISI